MFIFFDHITTGFGTPTLCLRFCSFLLFLLPISLVMHYWYFLIFNSSIIHYLYCQIFVIFIRFDLFLALCRLILSALDIRNWFSNVICEKLTYHHLDVNSHFLPNFRLYSFKSCCYGFFRLESLLYYNWCHINLWSTCRDKRFDSVLVSVLL